MDIRIWVRRPIIWVACAYGLGIALSYYISLPPGILLVAIILSFFIALYLHCMRNLDFIFILIIFILIGWLRGEFFLQKDSPLAALTGKEVYIAGEIVKPPQHREDRDIYTIRADKVFYKDTKYLTETKLRLTVYRQRDRSKKGIYYKNPYTLGDLIVFRGILEKPQGQRNPKGFDYRLYLKNSGIYNTMAIDHGAITYFTTNRVRPRLSQRIYTWMQNTIDRYIVGDGSYLLKSMLLAQNQEIPSDIRESFSRTGTAHILAISGLHVGFIMAGMDLILRRLYLRRITIFLIQSLILITYCIFIGAPSSAMRATIMAIIYLGGYVLNRPEDKVNTLAFTALLILLTKPGKIFDIGFQLSFAAVMGILFLYPKLVDFLYFIPKDIANVLSTIISAQLGVAPLLAYHYNIISPISIVANLFLVPIAGLIVQLGFLLFIFALILAPLAKFLGIFISYLAFIFIEGTRLLELIPLSSINIISPKIFIIICYYILLLAISGKRPDNLNIRQALATVIAILLIFVLITSILPTDLKVIFVDVGQGDCIYIRTPDRKHILIDGGGIPYKGYEQTFDVGRQIVLPFLLKNGVRRLDLVVASHWHYDHVGGLLPVLEEIPVDTFLYYPPYNEEGIYKEIVKILDDEDITKIIGKAGQSYMIGKDMRLYIMHPPDKMWTDNENNRSVVIQASYKDTSLILTGDIEREAEKRLKERESLQSDILKVAHHGSKTSSTDKWVEAVDPNFAVIQVGKNSFGHPHMDVINKLHKNGVRVYRTDRDGAVICRYKRNRWRVDTMVK